VLALPSFTEGLPNIILESFAAGVPVVATAVGGTPEAVMDGVDGFLIPPGKPLLLAAKIKQLVEDEDLRREMGRKGREKIGRQFTFEAQCDEYRRLFETMGLRNRSS
jgi:glycosyltransferase involved in cell wall biosynthesis